MGYKDNLVRKRDGTYVLKHKTKKHKEGDCPECGENPKDRPLGGLYQYKKDDMLLVVKLSWVWWVILKNQNQFTNQLVDQLDGIS